MPLNFLFINTDQQRWDSLGCYGSPVARTPNIDRLASEGMKFDRCYTAHPVCMPARASWFTGQYPSHNGCWQNGVPLDPASDMIHKRLKDAGYHTALIGKIHLDNIWMRSTPHPKYGFDQLTECEGDPYCKDEYFQWLDKHGLYDYYMEQFKAGGHTERYIRDIPEKMHQNNWIAGHVEEYFRARKADGKPFFLSVGFFDPHHPFDPCEPYASMFDPDEMPLPLSGDDEAAMTPLAKEKRKQNAAVCGNPDKIRRTIAGYHATIAHVDAMVGRIMKELRASSLEDDTVVIFTSDHGELLGDHGMIHKGPFFFDCSIHVPLIWRFPPAYNVRGIDDGFASSVDFAATVAELAEITGPTLMQGRPLFSREGRPRPMPARDGALTEWRGSALNQGPEAPPTPSIKSFVTDRWKYVHYEGEQYGELYDLANDPQELHNLWGKEESRGKIIEMRERLMSFVIASEPLPPRTDIF